MAVSVLVAVEGKVLVVKRQHDVIERQHGVVVVVGQEVVVHGVVGQGVVVQVQ